MTALFRWLHAECGIRNESDWIGHEVAFNRDSSYAVWVDVCPVAGGAGVRTEA